MAGPQLHVLTPRRWDRPRLAAVDVGDKQTAGANRRHHVAAPGARRGRLAAESSDQPPVQHPAVDPRRLHHKDPSPGPTYLVTHDLFGNE